VSKKKSFTVDDACGLETPADSIRLYGDWARTCDNDFVARSGYILYNQVADVFLRQQPKIHGAVLDIGCGVGLIGGELRETGVVDGLNTRPDLVEIPIYSAHADSPEHANDKAYVVVCRVTK
jgi:predicted TPR repeat methyltransferase